MEENLIFDFRDILEKELELKEVDVNNYSPLVLAYIGDCVFDLIMKSVAISKGNKQVQKLHKETSFYVQASSQSAMMRVMQEHLTEEEHAVYKRGRNAKSVSPAKNQSITDYRRATGFEALVGFLYLTRRYDRLVGLVKIGLNALEETKNGGREHDI